MPSFTFANECIAIIPARSGSKGVQKKNIKPLGGYPLIAYSIAVSQLSSIISRIIVSTDSEEFADISRRYGADVPFMRPAEYATDTASDYEVMNHAVRWLAEHEGKVPKYIAHVRATTPLRDVKIIDEGIRKFIDATDATSLRSAHEASETPYKWFLRDDATDRFKSIVSTMSNDDANAARQSLPKVYIPDGYIDVLDSEFILNEHKLLGDKMLSFISPCCMEVDTEDDFEQLEFSLKCKGHPLWDYLNKYYSHDK